MKRGLLVAGFAVHLIFFYSIFDIYFTSPLVHGMTPHTTSLPPPAKRLVLFVADGLRADKLFELDVTGKTRAPFLRSKVEKDGAWGVSHTRVPTESRPGHVALIAGFYEDVSAVAKGWKENPIDFDSVFNESRRTWSWGSPDILPMFAKGSSGDHVSMEFYPNESEDFAGSDLHKLDTWVFDKVNDFLDASLQNPSLHDKLMEDRIVFFLHLLGIDTNGHAHKPDSMEYLSNIGVVDSGIRQITERLEKFYNDGKTAYVFSADHGMTNWGSHGAGHPSETLTPLIAWGAGVRSALPPGDSDNNYPDNFNHEWKLDGVKRSDVNQADISPLMAVLIGTAFPMNSVGFLPLDYLNVSDEFLAQSLLTNARQILAQFEIKMKQKQQTTLTLLFSPFKALTAAIQNDNLRQIMSSIQGSQYKQAIELSKQTMDLALEGLNYYHNYDRLFLGVACGFLGWMMYVLCIVLKHHTNMTRKHVHFDSLNNGFLWSEKGIRVIFVCIGIIVAGLLYIQSLPWTYYLYCLLPVLLFKEVFQRRLALKDMMWYVIDHQLMKKVTIFAFVGIFAVEIMVATFFYRELLMLGLVAMGIWVFFTPIPQQNKTLAMCWLVCCLVTAVFPLLPVMGRQVNYSLVYLAGFVALLLTSFVSTRKEVTPKQSVLNGNKVGKYILFIQVCVLLVSVYIVWSTSASLSNKEGLPLINQAMSWIILGLSFVLPACSESRLYPRLLSVMLALMSPYLLLSTAQEGLFLISMCLLAVTWLHVEHYLSSASAVRRFKLEDLDFSSAVHLGQVQRKLVPDDLRCALFFIFLLLNGFFGTGNIASINTFDPRSVFCFLTVFSPFIMGILMMWKNLIPLLIVTCTFDAIHLSVNVPTQSFFLLVLLMSDFMALHFFFLVRDYGSWLEIGTSISHYVIVMCLILFLILLLTLSKHFTQSRLIRTGNKSHGQ